MVELSIVVPVFGCASCLEELHRRLHRSVSEITSSFELIFIDDGSTDGAWPILERLALEDPAVRAYRFSRNFGQHASITAGLAQSTGRWTVVMDCDLQDPPEEIARLFAKAQEGYEIVFTRQKGRAHSWWRRTAASLYFRLVNTFLGTSYEAGFGSFSILSRKVVDAFLSIRDRDRQYLLILHWLGFRHTVVEYEHARRHSGESSYSWRTLLTHAANGVFFQTTTLMRWVVYGGFILALGGLLLAGILVGVYFAASPPPGWTSLAVLLLLVGGAIVISMGVAGLYIGKIFEQVKDRPLYVIDQMTARETPAGARDEVSTPDSSCARD